MAEEFFGQRRVIAALGKRAQIELMDCMPFAASSSSP